MPFPFVALIISVGISLAGQILASRAVKDVKPSDFSTFKAPTASEDRPRPVLWGRKEIKAPNTIWWGDYANSPIKKKVGFIITKTVVQGYRYFVGLDLAVCHGPLVTANGDGIKTIKMGNKTLWAGSVTSGTLTINQPTIFGGDEKEGGASFIVDVYPGDRLQAKSAYLVNVSGPTPAYRGTVHLVFGGPKRGKVSASMPLPFGLGKSGLSSGYIGTSTNLKPISIEAARYPSNLSGNNGWHKIGEDANPIECLYELLTNSEWGLGAPVSAQATSVFQLLAQTCYNEGIGFSLLWDTQKPIKEIADEILKLVDGVINIDMGTGKYTPLLIRRDYDPDSIPVYNSDNIVDFVSYSHGAWDGTVNDVRLVYADRAAGYKDRPANFKSHANARIQDNVVPHNLSILGVSTAELANRIVTREAKTLSIPLAKLKIKVNREGAQAYVGGVFKWVGEPYEIDQMLFRVTSVDLGTLEKGEVTIEATEDVFGMVDAIYANTPASTWVNPVAAPTAATTARAIEQPYFLSLGLFRMMVAALRPNDSQLSYDLYVSEDNGASYDDRDQQVEFTPTATLAQSYGQLTSDIDNGGTLVLTNVVGVDQLYKTDANGVARGVNLMLVDDELMAFEDYTDNGDGTITPVNVWRGLLDTVPAAHSTGARAWLVGAAACILEQNFAGTQTVRAKPVTNGAGGQTALTDAPTLTLTLGQRALRPYVAGNFRVNGSATANTIPATGDVALAWAHRNRLAQTSIIRQTAADVTPEIGTTYVLRIYNDAGSLIRTQTFTGTGYTYTNAQEIADNGGALSGSLAFVLYSLRDGLQSFQAHTRIVTRPGGSVPPSSPAYSPGGSYTAPPAGNAISGVPVSGSPTGTNNTPVYNPTTGLIEWQPGGGGSVTVEESDGSPSVSGVTKIKVPAGQLTNEGGGVVLITPLQGAQGPQGPQGPPGEAATGGGYDGLRPASAPAKAYFADDFLSGPVSSQGAIGGIGWTAMGPAWPLALVSETNHPGILRIDTTTTINTIAGIGLHRGSSGAGVVSPADTFDVIFIVRLNSNDASTLARLGLMMNPTLNAPADGVYIEKLAADTSWFGVTRASGTQNRTAALASTSSGWVKFRIRRVNPTTVGFTVDGGAEVTATLTIPTAQLVPALYIVNSASSSKTLDVDYFDLALTVTR